MRVWIRKVVPCLQIRIDLQNFVFRRRIYRQRSERRKVSLDLRLLCQLNRHVIADKFALSIASIVNSFLSKFFPSLTSLLYQRLVLPKFYNWQREVRNISPLTLSRKTLLGKVAKIIDTAFSVRKGEGFEFMFLLFFKGTRHQLTGLRFPGHLFDILYYWVVSWRADLFQRLHLPQSVEKND